MFEIRMQPEHTLRANRLAEQRRKDGQAFAAALGIAPALFALGSSGMPGSVNHAIRMCRVWIMLRSRFEVVAFCSVCLAGMFE
jgi:hypothetical protein